MVVVVVVVVKEFGLEKEFELKDEGGPEHKSNEDVLSPNTRKTTDRRRAMGHEFERSPGVDVSRPPS